jgi:hypothetical protein
VTRQQLTQQAVLEAARHFMAWQLVDERAARGGIFGGGIPTSEVVEALQGLRDALVAERAARAGR